MPFGDGTGPRGSGPMTGRGAGFCTGYAVPGYRGFRQGWACWDGGDRGRRNQYYATGITGRQRAGAGRAAGAPSREPMSPDVELTRLKIQVENLTRTLDGIRQRIEALGSQGRKE